MFNDKGELLNFVLTPGNTDDRTPVPKLLQRLFGKVFADKGYISQKLARQLLESIGVQLITGLRRNMKPWLMQLNDRRLLRKHAIIETIIDQLKNISQIVCGVCRRQTLAPPLSGQLFGQYYLWVDCLLPPVQEAVHRDCPPFALSGLTRTHVNQGLSGAIALVRL